MKIRAAKAARSQELAKSPLLHKVLLSEKQQQVELFVLDVGRGLFSNIALWKEEHGVGDARQAQPLRRTASVLFSKPLSRHNRSIDAIAQLRGGSTGLMHLNAILCHQNDNTRIVTGTEWLAGPHPRPSGFMDNSTATGGYLAQRDLIEGTFFHLGISPSVIPKLTKQWFSSDKDTHADIRQAIIRKFARTTPRSKLQSRAIDIRSGEGLRSVQTRVESTAMVMAGTIVRVNRIAEKNLVNQIVLAWIRGSAKSKQKNSTLFLCDLGRYQAIDIVWVIENMFRPKERYELEGLPADSTIFLVTEDLCCTELKVTFKARRDGKVQPQISSPAANISKLENRLVYLLEELRVCDSIVLWDRVRSLARNSTLNPNPVMLEDVLWPTSGTTKVLPSYLNFAALVQDSDAARCIRRSLRRILALFPDANDLALDSLVEASLHDAKKWLIRPQTDTSHKVLIGSLSVSGSTLKRFRLPPKTTVAGIVDCIRTPYFNFAEVIDEAPHLAALLWDPILPTTTDRTARYRRVGRSAYVEAVSNASFPVSYDEVLYTELESANLVKVGHWSHGERHSLLELNAELAIEQSAASESGAITWLVRELKAICKGRAIVLAFPVDKLAYRLAHHVKSRMNSDESIATVELSLLPMSFMPRFAGGLTRFAPLVMDAARNLATQMSAKRPIAVFLDFGFITNRTVRHAMRQLTDAGFEDIRAMGLLNRSSAPELLSEKKQLSSNSASFPHAFWRWNVPILGTGLHCPLCGALPTFGRLRRLVEDSHRDLLLPLAGIGYAWRARDITDFWEEFGLAPLALSDKIRTQLSPVLAHISVETAYTSSTLAARAIEYLRATGDSEKPLQLALVLLNESGEEHATELLCISLLLSGGT
ncbi:MAG TPA: hypothetical protein PKN64_06640, partial [Casimicrobium sp.]|nr:hypothetical protein [Casimicrobium sp.]